MITILIIALTALVSYMAFNNQNLIQKYIFYPPAIANREWYRFFSYGFLHADFSHLIFNMFALYLFGSAIEQVFQSAFGTVLGGVFYLILYFSGLLFSILPTWVHERHNSNYSSLGASGAVSAVVFAYILIYPMSFMGVLFVPVFIPAFLFGIIYVVTSIYLEKNYSSNINHSAHVMGGLYGIVYLFIVFQVFADINIFRHFVESIQISSWKDLIRFEY